MDVNGIELYNFASNFESKEIFVVCVLTLLIFFPFFMFGFLKLLVTLNNGWSTSSFGHTVSGTTV
jgi:hypothetical protein